MNEDDEAPLVEVPNGGEFTSGVLLPLLTARLSNLFSKRARVSRMWTIVLSFLPLWSAMRMVAGMIDKSEAVHYAWEYLLCD